MKTLSNGWKIPTDKNQALDMLKDFEKNLREMELENPIMIFKDNIQSGILFKAASLDANNHLMTYINLYMSAQELREYLNQ
jgi:hypothetical protein